METHETRGGPGSSIRAQMSAGGEGGSGTLAGNRQVSFVMDKTTGCNGLNHTALLCRIILAPCRLVSASVEEDFPL